MKSPASGTSIMPTSCSGTRWLPGAVVRYPIISRTMAPTTGPSTVDRCADEPGNSSPRGPSSPPKRQKRTPRDGEPSGARASAIASTPATPLALSSAPGLPSTVSQCAPTSSTGRSGSIPGSSATRFTSSGSALYCSTVTGCPAAASSSKRRYRRAAATAVELPKWRGPWAVSASMCPRRCAAEMASEVGDIRLLRPYRLGGLLEGGQLAVGQRGLDDLLHPGRAQLGEDTEVHAGDAVLAIHPGTHRPHVAGVLRDRPGHPGRRRRRGVVRRAGLEQRDDLGAAVAGTDDEFLDLLGREYLRQRLAVDRAPRRHGHHGGPLRAQRQGLDGLHRYPEFLGDEVV